MATANDDTEPTETITATCPYPVCGRTLKLVDTPDESGRKVGFCICPRFSGRPVIEVEPDTQEAEPIGLGTELLSLPGVKVEIAAALRNAGYYTVADVDVASDEALLAIAGIGPRTLASIRKRPRSGG